jgi:hypothetical protein
VLVIHGRRDALASVAHAEALAARLRAPCVVLEGAHFIVRECAGQINALLAGLVLGHTHFQVGGWKSCFWGGEGKRLWVVSGAHACAGGLSAAVPQLPGEWVEGVGPGGGGGASDCGW